MARVSLPGRETRLLLLTIAVSAGMLLVLARFRFPQTPKPALEAPAAPLERLAARATYDELTAILRNLDDRIDGSIFAVRVGPGDDGRESAVPAVRLPGGHAVALLGQSSRVISLVDGAAASVRAVDPVRGLALLDIPAAADVPDLDVSDTLPTGPGYAAAIEATRAGPAVRPMYFGRVDRVDDPTWGASLARLSALQQALPAGAAVFSLDGRFLGLGMPDGRDLVLVPPALLRAAADQLAASGTLPRAALGIDVQVLDRALVTASGVAAGVAVTYVDQDGPAHGSLQSGDIVTAVAGTAVDSPQAFASAAERLRPGTDVKVEFVRGGKPMAAALVAAEASARAAAPSSGPLGLDLRASRTGAEVLRVQPGSAAAFAGIRAGDLITRFGNAARPSPADVQRAYTRTDRGAYLIVALDRGTAHVVVAVKRGQ